MDKVSIMDKCLIGFFLFYHYGNIDIRSSNIADYINACHTMESLCTAFYFPANVNMLRFTSSNYVWNVMSKQNWGGGGGGGREIKLFNKSDA